MYLSQHEIDALLKGSEEKKSGGPGGEERPSSPGQEKSAPNNAQPEKGPVVEKVEFTPLQPRSMKAGAEKVTRSLFDGIPLRVSGELGTAEISVRELLQLQEGSVLKLDKMAGESSNVLVNEQLFGQAEVVVINDRFGLRLTAIGKEEESEEKEEGAKAADKAKGRAEKGEEESAEKESRKEE